MFDNEEDTCADRALRAGLRALPTPEISADFDAAIQAALLPRTTWWQTLWVALRPAIPAALCTLSAMLLLLRWTQQTQIQPYTHPSGAAILAAAQTGPDRETAGSVRRGLSEEGMDSLNLTHASLISLSHLAHRNTD